MQGRSSSRGRERGVIIVRDRVRGKEGRILQGFNYFVAGGKPNNVLEFRRLGKKKESKIHIHMNMHNNINTNKSNKSNKTHPYKQQRLKASNICWKCTFIWKLAGEGHVEHALRCFAFRSIRIRVVGMVHVSINAIQLSTTSTEGTNGSPPVCGRWSTPSVSSNYPPKKTDVSSYRIDLRHRATCQA